MILITTFFITILITTFYIKKWGEVINFFLYHMTIPWQNFYCFERIGQHHDQTWLHLTRFSSVLWGVNNWSKKKKKKKSYHLWIVMWMAPGRFRRKHGSMNLWSITIHGWKPVCGEWMVKKYFVKKNK